MQRLFQKLDFPFMQQIDKYLLLNFPSIWATKIHYLAFVLSLYTLALRVIAAIYPIHLSDLTEPEAHYTVAILPMLIIFVIWVYQLTLFKVEKQFGFTSFKQQLRTQAIIMAGVFMFAIPPTLYGNWIANRIASKITLAKIKKDIENINLLSEVLGQKRDITPYRMSNSRPITTTATQDEPIINAELNKMLNNPALLQTGIDAHNKWCGNYGKILASPQELLAHYYRNGDDKSYGISYEVEKNIEIAAYSVSSFFLFHNWEYQVGLGLFGIALSLLLFLFLRLELRIFLLSSIVGILGTMLLGFLTALIYDSLHIGDELVVNFLFWAVLFGLLRIGFATSDAKRLVLTQKVAVSLASVLVTFIPLSLVVMLDISQSDIRTFFDIDNVEYLMVLCSLMVTLVSWNFFFNPKLQALSASPSQN